MFIKFYQKNVFQVLLNVFVALSIFTSSYYFFSEFLNSRSNPEFVTSESVIDFKKLPDVYFIIFDNMANFDVLNEYYNFDTSEINSQLMDNNYYIYVFYEGGAVSCNNMFFFSDFGDPLRGPFALLGPPKGSLRLSKRKYIF